MICEKGHHRLTLSDLPAETWVQLDPLIVSESCTRIEALYHRLLCGKDDPKHGDPQHCVCPQLHRHYGDELYRCHYFSCPLRRNGFSTAGECATHMENHCRPWKCPVGSCDFAVIGFLTPDGLERHRQRLHKVVRDSALNEASLLEDDALYPLLYGLVDAGDISELEAIWPACRAKVNRKTEAELATMAAAHGSLPMVQLLWEWDDENEVPRNPEVKFGAIVHDALQSGNPALSRWILEKTTRYCWLHGPPYRDVVVAVLKSDSADAFATWNDTLAHCKAPDRPHAELVKELFEKSVLNTAKRFPDQEHRLFGVWRSLGAGESEKKHMGKALLNVAQTTCSIEQARVLLELGAHINYPCGTGTGYTALHWACKKNTEEAAHFVRFLLLEGANPHIGYGHIRPEDEVGAKRIEAWLSMDWRQLIKWAKKERSIRDKKERLSPDE